jgi:hypothetical protein
MKYIRGQAKEQRSKPRSLYTMSLADGKSYIMSHITRANGKRKIKEGK